MAGLSNKNMRFHLNGGNTNVKVSECNSDLSTDLLDVTNSESAGFKEIVPGIAQGKVDIVIVAAVADTPYTALTNGSSYAVTISPDRVGSVNTTLTGTLVIASWQSRQAIRGSWAAHVTGEFTGSYTFAGL